METLELIRALMEMACPELSTISDDMLILLDVDDGGPFMAVPFKIFKTWKNVATEMINLTIPIIVGDGMYTVHIIESVFALKLFIVERELMELVIEWCVKHQDDVYDPSIDGPNFGIIRVDFPSEWDRKFLARISEKDLDVVMGYCKSFGIKPLLVLLVKEFFRRRPECGSYVSRSSNPSPGDEFDPLFIRNPEFSDLMVNLLALTSRPISQSIEIVCGEDGSKIIAYVRTMKMWRNISKDFVYVNDHHDSVFRDDTSLLIPNGNDYLVLR